MQNAFENILCEIRAVPQLWDAHGGDNLVGAHELQRRLCFGFEESGFRGSGLEVGKRERENRLRALGPQRPPHTLGHIVGRDQVGFLIISLLTISSARTNCNAACVGSQVSLITSLLRRKRICSAMVVYVVPWSEFPIAHEKHPP